MKKNERGYVTVEASIVLTIFIFAFLAMMSVIGLIRAQIIVQVGINQSAKELSQYSYILAKTGMIQKNNEVNAKAEKYYEKSDEVVGNLMNFVQAVQSGGENIKSGADSAYQSALSGEFTTALDNIGAVSGNAQSDFQNIKQSGETLYGSISSIAENPQEILSGLLAIGKAQGISLAKSRLIAAPISKALVKRYISSMGHDPDSYLKSLGIYEGLDGLNFNASTLFDDGSTINITVIYNARIRFPLMDKFDFTFKCNASTSVWGAKLTFQQPKSEDSIWGMANFPRAGVVSKIMEEQALNKNTVVAGNVGVDFYDEEAKCLTAVHSLNINDASYRAETGELTAQVRYTMNRYADKLERYKRQITMKETDKKVEINKDTVHERVLIMVVPESASAADREALKKVAEEVMENYEVKIEFQYVK